jgi:hypothetical protein
MKESYDKMNAKQKASYDKPRPNAPESQHTKAFKKKFGEQSLEEADVKSALKKKADKTGMPYGILKKVFDRGYAAWSSSHRPGTNPTQWGLARVNSFATKSSGTWGKADKDLAQKVRGESTVLSFKEQQELEEASLVMNDMDIVKSILKKIEDDISKLHIKDKYEKAWPLVNTLARMAGYKITKKGQAKNRTFRYDLKK